MATPLRSPISETNDAVGRILSAAEALFAEHGFEAVSMHAIAGRAGVSKANIFHHFTSKRELYLAVLRNACQDAVQHLQHLETNEDTFSQRFSAYAGAMLNGMLEREQLHRLIQRELLAENDSGLAKEMAEQVFGDKFARLVTILRNGQARGELRTEFDPAMAAIALIGVNLFFLRSRKIFQHFAEVSFAADPAKYSELLADILLHGLLKRPQQ